MVNNPRPAELSVSKQRKLFLKGELTHKSVPHKRYPQGEVKTSPPNQELLAVLRAMMNMTPRVITLSMFVEEMTRDMKTKDMKESGIRVLLSTMGQPELSTINEGEEPVSPTPKIPCPDQKAAATSPQKRLAKLLQPRRESGQLAKGFTRLSPPVQNSPVAQSSPFKVPSSPLYSSQVSKTPTSVRSQSNHLTPNQISTLDVLSTPLRYSPSKVHTQEPSPSKIFGFHSPLDPSHARDSGSFIPSPTSIFRSRNPEIFVLASHEKKRRSSLFKSRHRLSSHSPLRPPLKSSTPSASRRHSTLITLNIEKVGSTNRRHTIQFSMAEQTSSINNDSISASPAASSPRFEFSGEQRRPTDALGISLVSEEPFATNTEASANSNTISENSFGISSIASPLAMSTPAAFAQYQPVESCAAPSSSPPQQQTPGTYQPVDIDVRKNPDIFAVQPAEDTEIIPIATLANLAREISQSENSNVFITRENGRLIVRFKLPTNYSQLFDSSLTVTPQVASSTQKIESISSSIDLYDATPLASKAASVVGMSPVLEQSPLLTDIRQPEPGFLLTAKNSVINAASASSSPLTVFSRTPELFPPQSETDTAIPTEEEHGTDIVKTADKPYSPPKDSVWNRESHAIQSETLDVQPPVSPGNTQSPFDNQDVTMHEDSEKEMLRRFISKVKRQKSDKTAESFRSIAISRRQSGSIGSTTTGSPIAPASATAKRQVLGLLDTNSPSPLKVKRKLEDNAVQPEESPQPSSKRSRRNGVGDENDDMTAVNDKDDKFGGIVRRSSRVTRKRVALKPTTQSANSAAESMIPVRLLGIAAGMIGDQPAEIIPTNRAVRVYEKDTAMLTRVNTRKNRGLATPPVNTLTLMNEDPEMWDRRVKDSIEEAENHTTEAKGRSKPEKASKGVRWDQTLVRYEGDPITTIISANTPRIEPATVVSKEPEQPVKAVKKQPKMSGSRVPTPARNKTQGVGILPPNTATTRIAKPAARPPTRRSTRSGSGATDVGVNNTPMPKRRTRSTT
jgi:hypothetical protein